MVISLWLLATITFFILYSIPGGPFTSEKALPPEVIEALNEKYHLNDPIMKQYVDYLKGIITFDLGPSFQYIGVEVTDLIKEGFPVSAKVGLVTSCLVVLLGVPLGVISALKKNRWEDYLVTIIATIGVAVPGFVIATIMNYVFSARLDWLPSNGLDSWKHYIGPSIALGGFSLAFIARLMRSSMLEVIQQDYIRTARAKGISEARVIGKHALKNASLPVIAFIGPMIAAVMTGSFVIERIFGIPGMGKFFVESVGNRDYTVIMGATVFYAAFSMIMIFVVDLIYGLIDPRIKLKE